MTEEEKIIEACIVAAIEPFKERKSFRLLERPFSKEAEIQELTYLEEGDFLRYIQRYTQEYNELKNDGLKPTIFFRNCFIFPPEKITETQLSTNQRKFSFYNCSIQERLEFSGELENSYAVDIRNQGCLAINRSKIITLKGGREIEINDSEIEHAELQEVGRLNLSKTVIHNSSIISSSFQNGAIFSDTEFVKIPKDFHKVEFASKNVNFRNVIFKERATDQAIGFYRSMKDVCEKAHYEHGVILFHGYELETYYNLEFKGKWYPALWPEKFSSLFHRAFTNYGRDVMRPFYWLIGFYFLGVLIDMQFCDDMHNAWWLALKDSLGPLVFAMPEKIRKIESCGIGNIFASIHLIISSIIWFLIIFMLRRRFKI